MFKISGRVKRKDKKVSSDSEFYNFCPECLTDWYHI